MLAERDARIEALDVQIGRRDVRLAAQDGQITALSRRLADLVEANEQLAAKLAKLAHLLSGNSANSSLPPSKDDDPGHTPPAASPARRGAGRNATGVSSRVRRERTWHGWTTRTSR